MLNPVLNDLLFYMEGVYPEASTPRIRASQTFLTLTNFIEKRINIYDIK